MNPDTWQKLVAIGTITLAIGTFLIVWTNLQILSETKNFNERILKIEEAQVKPLVAYDESNRCPDILYLFPNSLWLSLINMVM